MSFWNGTHWVSENPTPGPRRESHGANWLATVLMAIGLAALMAPMSFIAAASHHATASGCSVSPSSADVGETYMVSAWGIPTGTAVNLWVTEDGVTTGSPLGSTPDGNFNMNESSQTAGVTTYTFSGPTKRHMAVYGTCSVSAY
jgi:hypothetical protein